MHRTVSEEADRWLAAGKRALLSGSMASVLSTGVLAWLGHSRLGKPFAPTNATSHWLWGDAESFRSLEPSLRHSVVGYATHHASALMWAVFYERWLAEHRERTARTIVIGAALTTATAAFVDYQLTPKRLTPGFEAHLNRTSMIGVFVALGVGLATGAFLNGHDQQADEAQALSTDVSPETS